MVRLRPAQNRDVGRVRQAVEFTLDASSTEATQTSSVGQEANGGGGNLTVESTRRGRTNRLAGHLHQLEQPRIELLDELTGSALEFRQSSGNVPEGDRRLHVVGPSP